MIGEIVSHYKIIDHLGEGGMGVLFRAQDTRLGRMVALKFLPPDLTRDAKAKQRFIQEARAASAVQHDNICNIHDIDETPDGQLFIVMDVYDGETLAETIGKGPLDPRRVIDWALQIASGLKKAHDKGIIHRDIKPANVFVTEEGTAKILDFGLAKLAEAQTKLTDDGSRLGTTAYMSPEQARGDPVDVRTDIWSLGVMLYEMITGRPPFRSEYEQALIYAILNEEPVAVQDLRPGIPDALEKVVNKMLAKEPDLRYQQMEEVIRSLKQIETSAKRAADAPAVKPPSIAILPFANLSADSEQEYFCDGLTEEIINVLSHLEELRIVARTSTFAFKGKHEDIREIGKKLNVENVLEGSVRKSGNLLRITAQLVKAADGYHLWSEKFDRKLEDIFSIQDEISLAIVENLKVKLLKGEKAWIVRHRASNSEAYNLYMKGRFFFNQRKDTTIQKSLECYAQAIQLDPGFALAYTGLAESYLFLGDWRVLPIDQAYEKARKEAMTALRLDDALSEAHLALAEIKMFCDWDWISAEEEFQQALSINPACAEAHHMYAHFLELKGRFDEALTEIERAIELEPVFPSLHSCNVQMLFYARRYDQSIEQSRATMEMAPHFFGQYGWLGIGLVMLGRPREGIEAIRKGLDQVPMDARMQGLRCYALASVGDKTAAMEGLEQLVSLSQQRYLDPYFVVWGHAALGENGTACDWLDRAYNQHSEWLPWVGIDPLLDGLRVEPRFRDLLRKMNLSG